MIFCKKKKRKLDYYQERHKNAKEQYFDLLMSIREIIQQFGGDGDAMKAIGDIKDLCEEAIGWIPTLDIHEMNKAELHFHITRSKTLYNLEDWAPLPEYVIKRLGHEKNKA